MEVESGIRPLEIRREELSIRQATKILMKDNSSNIKCAWNEWIQDEKIEHRLSPFGKMNVQLAAMTYLEYCIGITQFGAGTQFLRLPTAKQEETRILAYLRIIQIKDHHARKVIKGSPNRYYKQL